MNKLINISGNHIFGAPREKLWPLLFDPNNLMEIIPGCKSLEVNEKGNYHGKIQIGLAGISGNFITNIRIVDTDPPQFCRFSGEVSGSSGVITGSAEIILAEEDENCLIVYNANGIITGALGYFNPRYIEGITQTLIKHGLNKLERNLNTM